MLDKMLRKLLLAVVLGVVLGAGITFVPSSIDSASRANPMQLTPGVQYKVAPYVSPWLQIQPILVGLIAGLVIAVPMFLLAKRAS